MKCSCNKGFFIVTGLMGLSMKTLIKHDWTECSLRNNVYNAKYSVKARLDDGIAIEYTYFLWLYLFAHYCHYYSI